MKLLLLFLIAVYRCSSQEFTGLEGTGPKMLTEPLDNIFNTDSNLDTTYLDCEASGDQRPTYSWRRNGNPLDIDAEARYQLTRGRLTITRPDQDIDAGDYQCFPSNQIGTIMSRKAKLEFAYVSVFGDTPENMVIPVNTGRCISCNPPEAYPGLTVSWYNGPFPIQPSRSYHITEDGRLCFANFMSSDAGEYKCFVRNIIDTAGGTALLKYSNEFSVASGVEEGNSEDGPTVATAVEDQEVVANQKVKLNCFFFGNPVPNLLWRRRSPAGVELPMPTLYELKSDNQQLVLKNIQVDDGGEYECYTEIGGGTSSGNIVVKVPPVFAQKLSDISGNIHETVSWTCEAENRDDIEVTYTWYRNAEEITDLPRHQISNGLKTLTIRNLTVADTGMYQCVVSSKFGELYSSGQLTVLAMKPWFENGLQDNQPAPRGGNVTILCRPEAAPTPTITWTKDSTPITTDGHYTIMDNGDLHIMGVTDADGGQYTCTAQNSIGTGSSSGSLIIKDGTAIVRGPTDVTINEGETGTLTCLASHDEFFDLRYVWLKESTQVDLRLANYEQIENGVGEASELVIRDATMDLAGVYTCQAVTVIDDASASAVVTVRGRPGPPAGIRVEVAGRNANVSWSHGADNNSPIQSYIIEGSTNHVPTWTVIRSDIPAASTHIRLTGLSAWSNYKFRVVAVNEVGRGEPSEESSEQETAQDRPTQAPANVGGGGGNEGDLRITWEPLPSQEWNAPGLSYIVSWKQQGSDEDFVDDTVDDPETGVYVTSGVPAYTPFEVKIQVENLEGPGPITDVVIVYSFQRTPEEAPTGVTAEGVSSTTVKVSWTGIDAEAIVGVLEGYKIKYWKKDETEELGELVTSSGSGTEAMVNNLEPNTEYNIKVLAFSGAGYGPPSTEPVLVVTLKALTTSEMQTQAPTLSAPQQAPTDVSVTSKGTNSMVVKWKPITTSENEAPLVGYKVLYWRKGDYEVDAAVEKVGKTTNQITIDGLQKGTTYLVKVRGYSSGGDGVTNENPQEIIIGETENTLPRGSSSHTEASILLVCAVLAALQLC